MLSWSHRTDWGLTDQALTPETVGGVIEDAFSEGLIKTHGISKSLRQRFARYFGADGGSSSHLTSFINQQEGLGKIDAQTADLLRTYLTGN